jgi:hypothetical protein
MPAVLSIPLAKTSEQQQVKQNVILGRVFLAYCRSITRDYHPENRKIDAVLGEAIVGIVVLVKTYRRPAPVSDRAVEKLTGIPRSNVRRYASQMVEQGILTKHRGGFMFNPDYIPKRQDRRALKYVRDAVLRAARELEKVI